jgi:hypothetical protein
MSREDSEIGNQIFAAEAAHADEGKRGITALTESIGVPFRARRSKNKQGQIHDSREKNE